MRLEADENIVGGQIAANSLELHPDAAIYGATIILPHDAHIPYNRKIVGCHLAGRKVQPLTDEPERDTPASP